MPRKHVPRVADAQIADVERAECLAVARAAAIVRLEDQRALRQERVDGVGRRAPYGLGRETPVGPP